MKKYYSFLFQKLLFFFFLYPTFFSPIRVQAQTPTDGLMMSPGNLCIVGMNSHEQWKNYWEGELKRENLNLGYVTTQSITAMAALGVSEKVNVLFSLPYVWTGASAGTLHGQKGLQDVSLHVKWKPYSQEFGFGKVSAFAVVGFSTPVSNYTPDFLPLSIGLGATTASLKGILHYRAPFGAFLTLQGGYMRRNNVTLDRTSYFTDHMVYSNEVVMPDAADGSIRTGYLGKRLIAEVILSRFTALDGFDIRRNDMPFPSNLMQATRVGTNIVYRPHFIKALSIQGGLAYTTHGRNMGQATTVYGAVQYIFQLWKKSADPKDTFFETNN